MAIDVCASPAPRCGRRRGRAALALSLGLALACAKVGPPAGGPVDREGPRVVRCSPAPDTTGVGLDRAIVLVFSEAMDRQATEGAVYLSPQSRLDFDWRGGRELRIRPRGGLRADRTYVVTVGSDARDLRRNRMERSYTAAFATGAELNRGRLSGAVRGAKGPARGASVWAYEVSDGEGEVGELGVAPPSYRTQTGTDGAYEFLRLSAGAYRVLAFDDGNDNERCDRGEPVGLPAGDAALEEGGDVALGDLVLAAPAGRARLERAQAVDQGRVLLVFDREVEVAAVTARLAGLAVEGAYLAADDSRKLYLLTAPQEAGRTYGLEVEIAGEGLEWEEPVRGSRRSDRVRPELVEQRPARLATAADSIVLVLSEPLAALPGEGFWVRDDSSEAPPGAWQWVTATAVAFAPDSAWAPGPHRLVGRLHQLADRAGLAPAESLATLTFEVLAATDLAAIGGRVTGGRGEPVWVEAGTGARARRARAAADGSFLIEGLVPGPVPVAAFADRNGNGVRDRGQRHPYEPAEAAAHFDPDPAPGRGENLLDLELELR